VCIGVGSHAEGRTHSYPGEAASLAFVRAVVAFAGRDAGAQFQLVRITSGRNATIVAQSEPLVRFALEDRMLRRGGALPAPYMTASFGATPTCIHKSCWGI
jgi:hypothetical protein